MAFDAFLKIDGIDGESTAKGYEKWIEVLSFSWGCVDEVSTNTGGGGGAGKAMLSDLEFVTNFSSASSALFEGCATARHFATADLQVRRSGATNVAFYKARFSDILISSYQSAEGGDAVPTDSVSLNFVKGDFVDASTSPT